MTDLEVKPTTPGLPERPTTPEDLESHMARMGMLGDLEAVGAARPNPVLFFPARALRLSLARILMLDLEDKPEAWTLAMQELETARELAEPVLQARVS